MQFSFKNQDVRRERVGWKCFTDRLFDVCLTGHVKKVFACPQVSLLSWANGQPSMSDRGPYGSEIRDQRPVANGTDPKPDPQSLHMNGPETQLGPGPNLRFFKS